MFCPNCKTEYRDGFTKCSDCRAELVASLATTEGPPADKQLEPALTELWRGNDADVRRALCEELDRARIGYLETPVPEIHGSVERFLPFRPEMFAFSIRVRPDLMPARSVLDGVLARQNDKPRTDPSIVSPAELDDAARQPPEPDAHLYLQPANVEVWAGQDRARGRFIYFAIREVRIPARLERDEAGTHVYVAAANEKWARGIVSQIVDGVAPDGSIAVDLAFVDVPPESYLLAWLLPVLYIALDFSLSFVVSGATVRQLRSPVEFFVTCGLFWMIYQAIRYEIRPLWYCFIALFPLTFVWYYFERYSNRSGAQRLPIAVRSRA